MKKEYILTIKISVNVNDKVKGVAEQKRLGYIQQFLKTISNNESALRAYFKHYFTDLLLNGQCYEVLFDLWDTKDMPEIIEIPNFLKGLTPDAGAFIRTIYSTDLKKHVSDDVCVMYKDLISDQFSMPEIISP